jgi:methyltransferase
MELLLFLAWVILVRLAELAMAARNARWLKQQGAVEYGRSHYPFIVALHTCFLLAMPLEYYLRPVHYPLQLFWLLLFLLLTALKALVIATLGRYWNTRIYRVPGAVAVRKGIYRYIRHPNYVIVVLEFIVIPMVFRLYITALVFSVLNAFMLWVRIRTENRVWAESGSGVK